MTSLLTAADERFHGVVIGIVTDVDDPEETGRVKIRLRWYGTGYEEWARVAQLYAGDGFGSTFVPEVDTQVVVAFDHGDLRWPYVVGCLYSDADRPPESRTAGNDVKTIRTPSGSELRFDERNGVLELKTSSGAGVTLTEGSGELALRATNKISLSAPEIVIDGSSTVTVTGGRIALN